MKQYKKDFIKFLIDNKSLKFGEFTLKSGRLSPYFLNTGSLYNGGAISLLGKFYAETLIDNLDDSEYNVIFGPAYKGIPLAITTVNSLFGYFKKEVDYAFNRKEAKDHGDKGVIVGKQLENSDNLVLVDDVITAGTAIRESIDVLQMQGDPNIKAVIVSVDRMERGKGDKSAIEELTLATNIRFFPIVTIVEIIEYLKAEKNIVDDNMIKKMEEYRSEYGTN